MSNLEKMVVPWRGSKAKLMRGSGFLFFMVILFRP